MKLNELMSAAPQRGTYAGTYFDPDTVKAIGQYVADNGIPKPVAGEKLHTTLLYSRKHLPDYKAAGKLDTPMVGTPTELVVWNTQSAPPARCLVLKYDCPELVDRHKFLMNEHGATYDFPDYTPHVTLSYDIGDFDITSAADVVKAIPRILINEEYQEDLNLDWASSAHK